MSRRVIRIIDMKIEVTGDEEVVRSSSSRGKKVLELVKESRKLLTMNRRSWTAVDIEDSELGRQKFECDG